MKNNRKTQAKRSTRATAKPAKATRDYVKEYEEIVRLAQKDPVKLSHEWNKEGDVFKECTLYNDDRAVLTTHTVLL